MRTYIAYTVTTFKLVMRDRVVLFFNYFLPLMFFIVFAQTFRADKGGAISQVITMVLILGVLGSGFFGAGLRAVQERELNILRRFKVAPITPLPILIASLVTGLISYLPSLFIILAIARLYYGMPWPENWLSLTLLLSVGLLSFRSMGLIIAAVVNTMQESQIIIQLLYLPMLFLSGATFPVSVLPSWLQTIAQFLPASYLYTGLQGILVQRESAWANRSALAAMTATLLVATFLGVKLFRWEKDETMPPKAKLWLLVVFLPFLALGTWQAYSKENVAKAKILYREMRRGRALLIRGPRILTGDGKVIPSGAVLIRNGKIVKVFDTVPPEDAEKAETVEAIGKTLLPGLNDAHVHLLAAGGVLESYAGFKPDQAIARALAAYLYSGVTAVRSMGDAGSMINDAQRLIDSGDKQGAEVFHSGKMFTAPGGHGTEYFKKLPENVRKLAESETLFLPKTPEEARLQVDQAKAAGARSVKIILESGSAGNLFNRLDTNIAKAIADQARKHSLAVAVHTGDARDVADAIAFGASSIEHGSVREPIPDSLFAAMAKQGIAYDPTLTVIEALSDLKLGRTTLLDRTLVQQVAPEGLIKATKAALSKITPATEPPNALAIAEDNLRRAFKSGVTLVTGSDAGNMLVIHGPTVHREMQLWVKAGIPAETAIRAATQNTATLLGIGHRAGRIQPGYDATMLLIDGNPLEEIAATERISGGGVFFKGERIDRAALFEKE